MQFLYVDGAVRRELDLRVHDPGATVADLIDALDPGGGAERRLSIGARVVGSDLELHECGLHEGAVVRLDGADAPGGGGATGLGLEVVGGLAAGGRHALPVGVSTVGRHPGCDLVLDAETVSRRHAELTLRSDGRLVVRDLGSRNGTWVDGRTLAGDGHMAPGRILQFGAVQTVVRLARTADRSTTVDPLRHVNAWGTIPFNRPPRPASPPSPGPIDLPVPLRSETAGGAFNVVAFIAPLMLAGVLFWATRQIGFLAFTLLGPIMVTGNWIQARLRGRRSTRRERERYARDLADFRADLARAVAEEAAQLDRTYPDPAEVVRRATLPSARLWERRSTHGDFLCLRLGVGDRRWRPPVGEIPAEAPDDLVDAVHAAERLPMAPVTVDLSGGGVVGLVGDRSAALAVARSLMCQVAVHHGPADVSVMVLTSLGDRSEWDWAKWLPHTRDPADTTTRLLAAATNEANLLVEAWLAMAGQRDRTTPQRDGTGPALLVVVDHESLTEGRRSPARTLLRGGGGPVAGIVIAASADRLPAVCTAVVELRGPDGEAVLHLPVVGERFDDWLAAGMSEAAARECARSLARFEDPELGAIGAALPDAVGLLSVLGLVDPDADSMLARWRAAGADPVPSAPIAVAEDGAFAVDLRADGPHGLIGGTTGSGKSELLRTLIAGLAAGQAPDHLTFALIDFKGGSAFDECARLPHIVGLVTDLDEHMAERALRCLDAELRRRERALRAAGVADLTGYRRSEAVTEAMPRLVIVVDEFATLRTELPEFVDALVGVAQRGRSLGVHLVLATQRPSGAVSDNIRANTNLRIALRVQDDGDSTDIIDRPDAARLPRHAAGRAYVRRGANDVVAVQVALATAPTGHGTKAPLDLATFHFGRSARPMTPQELAAPGGDDRDTELRRLVDAIRLAHERSGRPSPRRPWPEPMPPVIDLDQLLKEVLSDADVPAVVFAVADDPDHQTQYPTGWTPDDGNLLIYGVGGSGTTTTLGSIALSLARAHPPDLLHVYAIDFGAGELQAIAGLPHTGGVIHAAERERQVRLIRHVRAELDRRRAMGIAACRSEPRTVVLVDGFAAFAAEYRDLAGMDVMDDFQRVFADGPEVGINVVVAADRVGAVPSALASLVRQKLLMRLADRYDYGQFGIPPRSVPSFRPGGAVVVETGLVVQVAIPAGGLAAAVERYARRHERRGRRPAPIGQLPVTLSSRDLGVAARIDHRPWRIPIGTSDTDLGPAVLVVHRGEHALIAGPSRAGKTTALATIAGMLHAAEPRPVTVTVGPSRSALAGLVQPDRHVTPDRLDRLVALTAADRPTLVLVDDADVIDDPTNELGALLAHDHPDLVVVAAGRAEALRGTFTHWTRALRRSRLGLLLRPNLELDGDLLGVSLPRRLAVAATSGRGFLVNGGEVELVQVALPEIA